MPGISIDRSRIIKRPVSLRKASVRYSAKADIFHYHPFDAERPFSSWLSLLHGVMMPWCYGLMKNSH